MLRRLLTSKNITPEEAKKLKRYLPRVQESPIDFLDYNKKQPKSAVNTGVAVSETVRYQEDDEPEGILTKLAAIRLHMHYGECIPGSDSPYLDKHPEHKKVL